MRQRTTIENDNREISLRIIAHQRIQRLDRLWAARSAAALAVYLIAMAGLLFTAKYRYFDVKGLNGAIV